MIYWIGWKSYKVHRRICYTSSLLLVFYILIFLNCFATIEVKAQDQFIPNKFQILNYSVKDGLASSEVYYTFKDSKGYIWFGTDNGVSRFDGRNFRNYGIIDGLFDSVIFQIVEDDNGRIYFYSMSGDIFTYEHDRIKLYEYNSKIKSRLKELNYTASHYFANSKIETFRDKVQIIPYLVDYTLSVDALGVIDTHQLVNDPYISIHKFDRSILYSINYLEQTIEPLFNNEVTYSSKKIKISFSEHSNKENEYDLNIKMPIGKQRARWAITEVKDNSILFSFNKKLYLIENDTITINEGLDFSIETIETDKLGRIWIGNLNSGGLWLYDNLKSLQNGLGKQILSDVSVSKIQIDQNGKTIWVSTIDNGVYRINLSSTLYAVGSNYSNLEFGNGDTLYIVNSKVYISALDLKYGRSQKLQKSFEENIRDFHYSDKYNVLWLCQSTISYLKGKTFIPVWYQDINTSDKIALGHRKIIEQGDMLYVTSNHGFGVFDMKQFNPILRYYKPNYDSTHVSPNTIYLTRDSTILLGTRNGIVNLNAKPPADPLLANIEGDILRIDQIQENTQMITTTNNGFYIIQNDDRQHFDHTNSALPANIEVAHIDSRGNLWLGTPEGLIRSSIKNNPTEVKTINYRTMIPSQDIRDIDSNDSLIAVAAGNGLYIFNNKEVPDSSFSSIYFDKVTINGHKSHVDSLDELKHNQNNLSITISSITHSNTSLLTYRYKLKSSENWTITNDQNLQFVDLYPGNYTLQIQSLNPYGEWGAEASLQWNILPPFWNQSWFIITLIILTGGIIIIIGRNNLENIRYKLTKEQEIIQLERSLLRSQLNPHFIFNILNSIQGFILHGDSKNASRYLSIFSKFMRTVLKVSKKDSITLADELRYAEEYVSLESLRMHHHVDYIVSIQPGINTYEHSVPPMILQPILENCFKHGFQGMKKNYVIKLDVKRSVNSIVITIRDNGKGLDSEEVENQDSSNFGNYITKRRLQLNNKHDNVNSLESKTIKDADGEVLGTEVKLYLN